MKNTIKQTIKILFFVIISGFLFWLVYRGQDVDQMKSVLRNDVDYKWVWASLILGLLSHVSRSQRWIMLIEPLGMKPRFINSFLSVMIGYLLNLALPRMGEISRCTALSKYERISFSKLVGTVVIERTIDVIIMLLFTAFVSIVQFKQVIQFLKNNPEVQEKINNFTLSPIGIGIFLIILLILFFIYFKIRHGKLGIKIKEAIQNFAEGLKSIKNLKHPWIFIFHSLFIWLMYFLMLYVMFFAFEFTSHLSWLVGLTVFVFGAYGMVAPVQGGIGAWHFMVIQALIIYGIAKDDSLIFAFLTHSSMNVMIVIVGLISLVILPIINRNYTPKTPN
ncbi:MAG: lysylphosphatidylglycerol synthase transmembrane domain-containing protein [Mangrovibacterium sp.]